MHSTKLSKKFFYCEALFRSNKKYTFVEHKKFTLKEKIFRQIYVIYIHYDTYLDTDKCSLFCLFNVYKLIFVSFSF